MTSELRLAGAALDVAVVRSFVTAVLRAAGATEEAVDASRGAVADLAAAGEVAVTVARSSVVIAADDRELTVPLVP